jgi:hypothetical protein
MRVVLEPVSGTAEENLDRAKLEIERVVAFRSSVTSAKGTHMSGRANLVSCNSTQLRR